MQKNNMSIEEDPLIGRLFDTPEKKAKWIVRLRLLYILWILFVALGIIFLGIWYFLH